MIGLNASPNITRFAHRHGVTRQSVVDVLKLSFGDNLPALLYSTAFMTREGVLRLSHNAEHVDFDIEKILFIPDVPLPVSSLGVLTPVTESNDIFILKTI